MSKKIVKITKEGVRESISGNAQELPSSAQFKLEGVEFVQDVLSVVSEATGTVGSESLVFAISPAVVVFPENPTSGQKITVVATVGSGPSVGVSASHNVDGLKKAIAFGPQNSFSAVRSFYFIEFGGQTMWISGDQGGVGGLTGSYKF